MKLSIIMPCFNTETTLEEAVKSIQTQNFDFDYEIIMIDDCSTDGTMDLIRLLSTKYKNIRYLRHDKNKGGGATRDTGIKDSKGQYIFCLDGDDILSPHSLTDMIHFADKNKADAVAFYERRFFAHKNYYKYKSHFNTILERPIVFEDIWNGSNMILGNFIFTRKSYDIAGGYQDEHGFDTQAYEISYLSKGFKVSVCPHSIYYHRQQLKAKSYFERVYEKGLLSINYYLSIEKILPLFDKETVDKIMRYNIFENASMQGDNIKKMLDHQYKSKSNALFDGSGISTEFVGATQMMLFQDYKNALQSFENLKIKYGPLEVIILDLERCKTGLMGIEKRQIVDYTLDHAIKKYLRQQANPFIDNRYFRRTLKRIKKVFSGQIISIIRGRLKKIWILKKIQITINILKPKWNIITKLKNLHHFFSDLKTFLHEKNTDFTYSTNDLKPCIFDKTNMTPVDPIYFYQDSWCARKIFENKPQSHVDIGSSVEMIGIISQFTKTTFVDIRPINLELDNLTFKKGSILSLPFSNDSVDSLSSICVIEHIGLGRYGDHLDAHGHEKAIQEIIRILKTNGNLYISLPVDGTNKLYFNAHRAFTRDYILRLFEKLKLIEEKYIYGRKMETDYSPQKGFGTGMFHFRK